MIKINFKNFKIDHEINNFLILMKRKKMKIVLNQLLNCMELIFKIKIQFFIFDQ